MPVQLGFNKRFFSHKFRSNGLKFEVGVCLQTGDIVWINGPLGAGMNDISVARQAVCQAMDDNEMAEADGGYNGEDYLIKTPNKVSSKKEAGMKKVAASRHETVNDRLKIFGILVKPFRHHVEKHSSVFRACAVITQLSINLGSPLFAVEYVDGGVVE